METTKENVIKLSNEEVSTLNEIVHHYWRELGEIQMRLGSVDTIYNFVDRAKLEKENELIKVISQELNAMDQANKKEIK